MIHGVQHSWKIKRWPANREKRGRGGGDNKGLTSNNIENGVTKVKKASTELMPDILLVYYTMRRCAIKLTNQDAYAYVNKGIWEQGYMGAELRMGPGMVGTMDVGGEAEAD